MKGVFMDQQNNATTNEDSQNREVYTCPMHPEVQQNNSGRCPKCGMNLVKQED